MWQTNEPVSLLIGRPESDGMSHLTKPEETCPTDIRKVNVLTKVRRNRNTK